MIRMMRKERENVSEQWYEALAFIMRYWFAALAFVTVYRALRWMLADARLRRKAIRALPDAGYIGHFLVLSGESRALAPGDEIQLPCEGTLGYSRRCDVCIRHKSLFAREAFFWLEQDGLHMSPIHSGSFIVDSEQVGAGDEAVLLSGARLLIGEVALELKLLKGLQLDGVFEQPTEPYVTPERRKRAKRATQRAASAKKRASSPRTSFADSKLSSRSPGENSHKTTEKKKTVSQKPRGQSAAQPGTRVAAAPTAGELTSTPRPRRARKPAGAQPSDKAPNPSTEKARSSSQRAPSRRRLNPPED